jgi:hypothetical protein
MNTVDATVTETTTPQIIDGLRALADWLEAHPEYATEIMPGRFDLFFKTKDELLAFKDASGATRLDKGAIGSHFWLTRSFGGGITLDGNVPREEACRRVVTGIREIPAQVIPASTEEDVEWICEPLLADGGDSQ